MQLRKYLTRLACAAMLIAVTGCANPNLPGHGLLFDSLGLIDTGMGPAIITRSNITGGYDLFFKRPNNSSHSMVSLDGVEGEATLVANIQTQHEKFVVLRVKNTSNCPVMYHFISARSNRVTDDSVGDCTSDFSLMLSDDKQTVFAIQNDNDDPLVIMGRRPSQFYGPVRRSALLAPQPTQSAPAKPENNSTSRRTTSPPKKPAPTARTARPLEPIGPAEPPSPPPLPSLSRVDIDSLPAATPKAATMSKSVTMKIDD